MSPSFYDFSSFDDDDIICFLHRLESMSNHDDSTTYEELIKSYSDLLFRERVQCRGRLIQKDDLWIFQEYLRYSQSLLLSSGQSHSSFSDLCIKSCFHIEDEITVGEMEGIDEFLLYTPF